MPGGAPVSYRAGIAPNMRALGMTPRNPDLICDGCGKVRAVTSVYGLPYSWLLDRKRAPGWTMVATDENRLDYCPRCKTVRR